METRIEARERTKVAAVRHVGPYENCKPAWEKLIAWANETNQDYEKAQWITVCYDDPANVPADQLRSDICMTIPEAIEETEDVKPSEIAGGEYLVGLHKGPYSELGLSYQYLYVRKMQEIGREPRCLPPFELYLNCPESTPEQDLLTEIWIPLKD